MAAALIPLVGAAVSAVSPLIPTIVRQMEELFGHSAQTGTPSGPAKMNTGVDILTTVLQNLANAGKIPSAPVVDPSLPAALIGAIQTVVDQMKANGLLGAPASPGANSTPSLPSSPLPVANTQFVSWKPGQPLTITLNLG